MGPQSDGLVISLVGELPWVAAIGFAFAAGVVLLIWRRTRSREEVAPQTKAAQGIGAYRIENHAAQPIPAENAAEKAVEEAEVYSDRRRVSDEPAPEEAVSNPVASEDSRISSEESCEANASDKLPVENFPEADVEVTILPVAIEAVATSVDIDSKEEGNPDNSIIFPVNSGE